MSQFSFNLSDFVFVWWGLLYEALPFVALGSLVSGILECWVSRETVTRLFPRSRGVGIAVGAALGLVMPMCECAVVPIVRRLMLKGVPIPCGIAFLLASPIVNPLVIASTFMAFRGQNMWEVVALRVGLGYLVAVLVATAVGKIWGDSGEHVLRSSQPRGHEHAAAGSGLSQMLAVAASEFIVIGGTLALGGAVAALINSGFSRQAMMPLASDPRIAVPSMMGLAIALNLCSEADAFVGASFYAFPLAAKIAFLVLGPMVDIKLILVYWAVFRPKATITILGLTTILVWIFCMTLPAWLPLVNGSWFR